MITIYEIPAEEYAGVGEPSYEYLYDKRIIAQEESYELVLSELVLRVNNDEIDTANCNLWIDKRYHNQ